MRSTKTATTEPGLHWMRVGGAHAGVEALYGEWIFRVYRWQPGCYSASAQNRQTGELHETGLQRGELKAQGAGQAFCEQVYQRLREADRAAGITRD